VERAERLLDLVALFLNAREAISWAEIQESFPEDYARGSSEANIRKFERDKADLAELGLNLSYVQGEERDKDGYLLDRAAYYLPNLSLGPDELAVLYAAGSAALAEPAFPFREDLSHALKKMAFAAGDEPGAGRNWSRVGASTAQGARSADVDELSRAVAARKFVEFDYLSQQSGERTRRRVDPYGLIYRFGSWVLVGHCHLRKAQRSFRVDRLQKVAVNDVKPRSPDYEIPPDFRIADHAAAHPWQFRRHAPIQVTLRLSPSMAWLAERQFASGEVTHRGRDGITLSLRVSDQDALLRALLPLGEGAEVVGPEALRARVRALLKDLSRRHATSRSNGAPAGSRRKAG
jgi:proteasome accessory factor B